MQSVYLVRHGETDFTQLNIAQGQKDVSLNKVGIQTIEKIGDYIAAHIKINDVFTSDLLRCKQTCNIIVNKLPYYVECVQSELLREIALGIFEGKPMKELNRDRYNSGDYNTFVPKGGESISQLTERVEGWFFSNYDMLNDTLIISHRGPISVIVERACNYKEFEINAILKQGNIIILNLFQDNKYQIKKIIEVSNNYD